MKRKLFISHSHKDQKYIEPFIRLLKRFGFQEKDLFYSSNSSTGVQPGQLILDTLKAELQEAPVIVYFLSQNYYDSAVCLNEMGASWVISEHHYPIALPSFSPESIKGALSRDRLALCLKQTKDIKIIYALLKGLLEATGVAADEEVMLDVKGNIQPFQKEMEKLIEQERYLPSNEVGLFEANLVEERELPLSLQEKYACFRLSNLVPPQALGLEELTEAETHWLFFFRTWGEFKEGDQVHFRLKDDIPYEQKQFKDIGMCKNIYASYLERVGG